MSDSLQPHPCSRRVDTDVGFSPNRTRAAGGLIRKGISVCACIAQQEPLPLGDGSQDVEKAKLLLEQAEMLHAAAVAGGGDAAAIESAAARVAEARAGLAKEKKEATAAEGARVREVAEAAEAKALAERELDEAEAAAVEFRREQEEAEKAAEVVELAR